MKKVLIVTTIQNTIEAFLIPHVKELEKCGYEVHLASKILREKKEELKNNRWHEISFDRNPFSKNSFIAIKELKKLMQENKYDMVHVHTPVAAFLGRLAAKLVGQNNVIYTAHGFHFYKGAPIQNWLIYHTMERIVARWTDKLITINEEDYQNSLKFKLRGNGSCHKISGIGVELEKFKSENIKNTKLKEKLKINKNDFVLLTLAELNENKNQIQVLKALKDLKVEYKNLKYLLAGEGSNENLLKKYCKENNLENNVKFLGHVDYELVPELINLSDVIISTSIREGLGLNIIEAMANGKSVIATKNRGHKEIIDDYINGIFVPIGDRIEVKNAIEYIYLNESKRKKMEKTAKETAKKFGIEEVLKELKEI